MNLQKVFRRTLTTMASPKSTVSPFTQVVVDVMRKLYPEKLADSSFDNTGLLLEAPYRTSLNNSVLLTIDLTKAVADEAIKNKNSIVIAYHPIIFRGLKSLTMGNTQQNTLLRLAQEGISVYSPHTAVDAAPGGLNDWLVDTLVGKDSEPELTCDIQTSVITPVINPPAGFEKAGYGRIVRFSSPQSLGLIIDNIIEGIGSGAKHLCVAIPQHIPRDQGRQLQISSVGVCAGSGGSMLNGLEVDLLFTGELSHHEALAAVEQGKCVITAFHSNTERGFLRQRMYRALTEALKEVKWGNSGGGATHWVDLSEMDRDPYGIVSIPGDEPE